MFPAFRSAIIARRAAASTASVRRYACCSAPCGRPSHERYYPHPRHLLRQKRALSFSFAGPRKLDEIMKLEMVEDKSSKDVEDLWLSFHEGRERTHGLVLNGKRCRSVLARAAQCPFFIQPVFRDEGFFTLVSQFQTPSHFLMAYLEDYKMDPTNAQPLITYSVFDDLVDSHGMGLVRIDVINNAIEDGEALLAVGAMLDSYGKDEEFTNIHAFNKKPEAFDFDDYISRQNQRWKVGS